MPSTDENYCTPEPVIIEVPSKILKLAVQGGSDMVVLYMHIADTWRPDGAVNGLNELRERTGWTNSRFSDALTLLEYYGVIRVGFHAGGALL